MYQKINPGTARNLIRQFGISPSVSPVQVGFASLDGKHNYMSLYQLKKKNYGSQHER
jgi:hypothetical protein